MRIHLKSFFFLSTLAVLSVSQLLYAEPAEQQMPFSLQLQCNNGQAYSLPSNATIALQTFEEKPDTSKERTLLIVRTNPGWSESRTNSEPFYVQEGDALQDSEGAYCVPLGGTRIAFIDMVVGFIPGKPGRLVKESVPKKAALCVPRVRGGYGKPLFCKLEDDIWGLRVPSCNNNVPVKLDDARGTQCILTTNTQKDDLFPSKAGRRSTTCE